MNVKEKEASYNTAAVDLQINSSAASINLDIVMDRFNFSSVLGAQITTQDGTYTLDNNVDDELLNSANLAANGSLDVDKKAGFDAETIAMFADFEAYMAANTNAETDNNIENLEQFSDILNQYDDLINDYKSKDKKKAKKSIEELINSLTKEMKEAAKNLDFEQAATLRDMILELKEELK